MPRLQGMFEYGERHSPKVMVGEEVAGVKPTQRTRESAVPHRRPSALVSLTCLTESLRGLRAGHKSLNSNT